MADQTSADQTSADKTSADNGSLAGVAAVLALVGGITAILFVLGGAVIAGRLYAYEIPVEIVVGQLPRDYLLVVGLLEVALPAVFSGLVYLMLRSIVWQFGLFRRQGSDGKPKRGLTFDSGRLLPVQFLAMGVILTVAVGLIREYLHGFSTSWLDSYHIQMAILAGVIISTLLGWSVAYLLQDDLHLRSKHLRGAIATVIGFLPLWVYNGATAPLLQAVLCPQPAVSASPPAPIPTPVVGYIVGGGDRLYFASPVQAAPTPRYVSSVPLDDGTLHVWNPEIQTYASGPTCPSANPVLAPAASPMPSSAPLPSPTPTPDR